MIVIGEKFGAPAASITMPIRTISAGNAREHHMVKAKRVRRERDETALWLPRSDLGYIDTRLLTRVVFTRISPRMLDTGDNLPSSMKAIRDEVMKFLGVSDGPKRGIVFAYDQERGAPKQYAVRVDVYVKEEVTV